MNIALCYNKEQKRLYIGCEHSNDSLFVEHDKKGWKTNIIKIPNEPIEIIIKSNLHYQGASYLYAQIKNKDKYLLNFKDIQALYLTRGDSINTFHVSLGDWQELFRIIIDNYNNLLYVSESEIDKYFFEIENIINSESISVCRNKTDEKPGNWNDIFLVLLHSIDLLSNIIKIKDESILFNNTFFSDRLLKTCKMFLSRFSECYPSFEKKEKDQRLNRLSKELIIVCEYINKYGKPLEYVDLLTNKITK